MVEPGYFIGDSCLELKNFVGLLTPIGVGIPGPFHVLSREAERRCYQADELTQVRTSKEGCSLHMHPSGT